MLPTDSGEGDTLAADYTRTDVPKNTDCAVKLGFHNHDNINMKLHNSTGGLNIGQNCLTAQRFSIGT